MISKLDKIEAFLDEIDDPNIAVIGLTGVGKSTLINAVFGMEVAKVGAGLPVTTDYIKYSPKALGIDFPLSIYDSPGYEAGSGEAVFVKQTINFIKEHIQKGKAEQIHLVWYVISAPAARLKKADIEILDEINNNHIPAIIILSQCDRASIKEKAAVRLEIENTNFSKVYETIEVSASPLVLENGLEICKPFGIKQLINRTQKVLPDAYSDAIIIAQIVDIESKKELAWRYVKESTIACFGGGALPVPLSAPASVITALGYMYNKIMIVYGHTNFGLLMGLSGVTLGGAITIAIDGVFDSFSILFPGISLLTGTASATFTAISGMAFIRTCEKLALGKVQGSEEQIKTKLREIFKDEFNKLSEIKITISTKDRELENLKKRFLSGVLD